MSKATKNLVNILSYEHKCREISLSGRTTPWETNFIKSVRTFRKTTERQKATIDEIFIKRVINKFG
jgi:hypothetical protein